VCVAQADHRSSRSQGNSPDDTLTLPFPRQALLARRQTLPFRFNRQIVPQQGVARRQRESLSKSEEGLSRTGRVRVLSAQEQQKPEQHPRRHPRSASSSTNPFCSQTVSPFPLQEANCAPTGVARRQRESLLKSKKGLPGRGKAKVSVSALSASGQF
jgi:hypothetical protein